MMDKVIEKTNGALSATEARAVLEQEAQAKAKAFNDGLVSLSEATGYVVMPAVVMPGGEIVSLASLLKALNVNAQPTVQIVPK